MILISRGKPDNNFTYSSLLVLLAKVQCPKAHNISNRHRNTVATLEFMYLLTAVAMILLVISKRKPDINNLPPTALSLSLSLSLLVLLCQGSVSKSP